MALFGTCLHDQDDDDDDNWDFPRKSIGVNGGLLRDEEPRKKPKSKKKSKD